jgi:glycosyltransferase involved in cell wall biosynthesis
VGRIAPVKRVEFLLEVARRLPDVRFRVAGMPYEGDPYSSSMLEALKGMPNIEYLGAVPRERMPELYGAASLLCCTSAYEGFPNTFIEAWSHGLPVVSTVDPDGLIQKNGLGAQATSEEAVARQISALLADSEGWRRSSAAARAHYMSRYPIDTAMARFEELFRGVAAGRFT